MGFEINTVTVSGNLTRDPELRSLPSGDSVCSLRIAHNSRRKDQGSGEWEDVPHYFNVSLWGGQGEWLANNVGKGDKVVVSGQLRWHEWKTKEGDNRQEVDINARDVIPVPKRDGPSRGGSHHPEEDTGFQSRSDVPADDVPQEKPPPTRPDAEDDIPF